MASIPTKECVDFWSKYVGHHPLGLNAGLGSRYELYIGYLYECLGWQVEYHGIENGLYDEGRDLICRKGDKVLLIQCKNWRNTAVLHENFIHQLTGSSLEYRRTHHGFRVGSLFVTSASLSSRAKEAAKVCGVVFREQIPFKLFPYAKCIVIGKLKIYYTPHDEEYLHETVRKKNGDTFCWDDTKAQAEGFQHF